MLSLGQSPHFLLAILRLLSIHHSAGPRGDCCWFDCGMIVLTARVKQWVRCRLRRTGRGGVVDITLVGGLRSTTTVAHRFTAGEVSPAGHFLEAVSSKAFSPIAPQPPVSSVPSGREVCSVNLAHVRSAAASGNGQHCFGLDIDGGHELILSFMETHDSDMSATHGVVRWEHFHGLWCESHRS